MEGLNPRANLLSGKPQITGLISCEISKARHKASWTDKNMTLKRRTMSEEEMGRMSNWRGRRRRTRKKRTEINHGVRERSCVEHFTRIDLVRTKDKGRRSRHLQSNKKTLNNQSFELRDNGKSCN